MSENSLPVKALSSVVDETLQYIEDRKNGKGGALKTGFKKLDKALLDGIE
jgi:replicative DNA helicase